MSVTADRFAQGLSYQGFRDQMTKNQERFDDNERKLQLSAEDLATFKNLPQKLPVLVIAEDWCGDVIDNLPILGRVAAESGKFDVKVFLRDQNLDLMDQYLKEGQFRSIPVFVVFDQQFQEIGRFIERPQSVTERRAALREQLYAQHPEFGDPQQPVSDLPEEVRVHLMQELATQREQTRAQDVQDVVHILRDLAQSAQG